MDLLRNKQIEICYEGEKIVKNEFDTNLMFDIISKIDMGVNFEIDYNMDFLEKMKKNY